VSEIGPEHGVSRRASPASAHNLEYIEAMHRRWRAAPDEVSPAWQAFFEGFELARECADSETASLQSRVASLIYAYRDQGHRIARLDPLGTGTTEHPQLALETFGLGPELLEREFDTGHLGGPRRATLRELLDILQQTYCRAVGVEYLHIQDVRCRRWLQAQMEPARNRPGYDRQRKLEILRLLVDAELFETFIGRNYPAQKRFSLEGAESLIPALHSLVELCPALGIAEIVLGMAHRGRLNVLANILDKSYALIFSEFEENVIPEQYGGGGDVKYHKGYSSDHVGHDGSVVHLSLTANPSHLEAVDPVVEGRARAKQRRRGDTEHRRNVLPLLIHGDAAFAGQGLVAETLNLSALEGYRTGGTVHIVVNNQIGFTTTPGEARSTVYCTDVAKMIEAPIFHVNGDDPEAVVFVAELALRFRQEFGRDAVVDMVCYRRHGHNEGDEPAFTQPMLYQKIKSHPSVRRQYTQQLLASGDISPEIEQRVAAALKDQLQRALEEVRRGPPEPAPERVDSAWVGLRQPYADAPVETAVPHEALLQVARALCTVPDGFELHPKVARQLPGRLAAVEGGNLDWALAEALAFGSLLLEGTPVRLSGQDSARGTFSHRHAVWQDLRTQIEHVPLNHIAPASDQAHFCVYNSMLSEAAVLGFDYGYSLVEPNMLILWEAQFGDFANGAQVIIDQFLVGGQAKWQRYSGLVLLLPHGYEGQGPEHSNAYLERYLAACAEENLQVCYPTTPAQYFHLLRRQVKRPFRRPLVVMAPKSLLRHPKVVSPVEALTEGSFAEILDDPRPGATGDQRLVLCSGKLYYDLEQRREEQGLDRVALVRIEQLYPFCGARMAQIADRHRDARQLVWAQEEPANRGAWTFVRPHLQAHFPDLTPRYVGRPASASPATGSLRAHREQQQQIVTEALEG
jgi:2-oxoglutarate dehydrogenase E1 component